MRLGAAPWVDLDAMRAAVEGWFGESLERHADGDRAVFVAEGGGRVVGFVTVSERVHFTGSREAYVGELVVAEESERRGVGRALMAAAEDWARGRGLARISLDTGAANADALGFYGALGYEEDDVRLSKAVT